MVCPIWSLIICYLEYTRLGGDLKVNFAKDNVVFAMQIVMWNSPDLIDSLMIVLRLVCVS